MKTQRQEKKNGMFSSWMCTVLLLGLFVQVPLAVEAAWVTKIIDHSTTTRGSPGDVGQYADVAVDSNNALHVSYYDASHGNLKYTTNASGSWESSDIDIGVTDDVGQYTSIDVDSSNKVHISYYNATTRDLKYTTNKTGLWSATTVDSSGNVGQYSSIAVDASGKVHISYYDATRTDLKYATYKGGRWVLKSFANLHDTGKYSAIAVDSTGKVHMSCYDATDRKALWVTNSSGSWVSTMLAADPLSSVSDDVGQYSSITVDTDDKVHISYHNATTDSVVYYTNNSADYTTTQSSLHGMSGISTSIVWMDSGERTIAAFDTDEGCPMMYDLSSGATWAWSYSGQCDIQQSDATSIGAMLNLAKDSAGNLHLVYYDELHGSLKYATNSGASDWSTDTLGWGGTFEATNTALAVNGTDDVIVAFYNGSDDNLSYFPDENEFMFSDAVGSATGVGEDNSLAIDSANGLHFSYYDRLNGALKYAYVSLSDIGNSGAISTDTVDEGTNSTYESVGDDTDIALDSTDNPHISYYDISNQTLKYAYRDVGGSWYTETVDDAADSLGQYTAIALDSADAAHICYYDTTNGQLKYTTNSTGGWIDAVVDATVDSVGSHCDIAIDASDNIHISYDDDTGANLKYAANITGSWMTEDVDTAERVGEYTAIAIDSSGTVHIAYYDETNTNLKYAVGSYGAWTVETADDAGDVGEYVSIGIDSNDTVFISYVDAVTGDVRVARNGE